MCNGVIFVIPNAARKNVLYAEIRYFNFGHLFFKSNRLFFQAAVQSHPVFRHRLDRKAKGRFYAYFGPQILNCAAQFHVVQRLFGLNIPHPESANHRKTPHGILKSIKFLLAQSGNHDLDPVFIERFAAPILIEICDELFGERGPTRCKSEVRGGFRFL